MSPSRLPLLLPTLLFLMPVHPLRPAAAAAMPVSFQTVARGSRSGIAEAAQIVVRDQAEWASLWQKHSSVDANPPAPPAIDFGKELVAAVFLGQKPTGGYAVEIVSVERSNGQLTVGLRETSPAPGAIATQAFTQAFHIVRIAIEGTPAVRFRRAP